jgi:CCR4-NOT complex subunit CAF16
VFRGLRLEIPTGSRCLLLGRNGVGKTTLLRIVAGKHLVPPDAVRVLGRAAFHDPDLARRVAFVGGPFPFDGDVAVSEMLASRRRDADAPDVRRRARLPELLDIDPAWRMSSVSSGQRRRVQILLGLLAPADLVLLDEVTADLDVLARADLLDFLREDCVARGATVVYATHVLDGLEAWATHLCFLRPGADGTPVAPVRPIGDVAELRALRSSGSTSPLLDLSLRWIREDGGR